jgi:hypothetical protein
MKEVQTMSKQLIPAIALLALLVSFEPAFGQGVPRAELSPDKFEIGTVWEGAPANKDFTIRNVGEAPLTIQTKSSCGCTMASRPKSPLMPGEYTTFTISYKTSRKGRADQTITLETNDPYRPKLEIPVTGFVRKVYDLGPAKRIFLQELEEDSEVTQVFTLKNEYTKPLPLEVKEGIDLGRWDVRLDAVKPGWEYRLTVKTVPPLELGWRSTKLVLDTGAPEVGEIEFPMVTHVPPRAYVMPPRVLVDEKRTSAFRRTLALHFKQAQPIKIEEVVSEPPLVHVDVNQPLPRVNSKMSSYRLMATVPAYQDIPEDGIVLKIKTDDKGGKYETMEVRILRKRG